MFILLKRQRNSRHSCNLQNRENDPLVIRHRHPRASVLIFLKLLLRSIVNSYHLWYTGALKFEVMNKKPTNSKKNNQKKGVRKIFEMRLNFNLKNVVLWLIILFFGLTFFLSFQNGFDLGPKKTLSELLTDIKASQVEKIEVIDSQLLATYKDGQEFTSHKEPQQSLVEILKDNNIDPSLVEIEVKDTSSSFAFWNFIGNVLPVVFMVVFFVFLFRQAQGAQDSIFSFGRSKARLFSKKMTKVTFADVAGIEEAKKEMAEVVDFLKHPKKYQALGARTPKGALLVGPSGTGKTLLARAVAGEANVPFFSMAGSEFMEMLVGVGASRTRDLFATAKKAAPSIIFIDEIESIGRTRSMTGITSHDEREQTLNQILVEMDGFAPNENVIVVAATNRPDLLDPALTRPGRFDRRIALDMPDIEGRGAILKIHARGKPFATSVNWDKVAKRTVGFSGADLENMLNEAAILAAREGKKAIDMDDLEEAATKVKLGPEKKRLQSDFDKKITAYHEAGHAIVTHELPNMDPVHRVSIVSRGLALGFTLIPPQSDRLHETRSHLLEQITAMMGGRVAEELIFNEMTSGAAADFDQATKLARDMVVEYGMSKLGPINFGPTVQSFEFGRQWLEQRPISQEMRAKIDKETKKIIDEGYGRAKEILTNQRKKLNIVAKELIKKESLDGEDFEKLMGYPKKKVTTR